MPWQGIGVHSMGSDKTYLHTLPSHLRPETHTRAAVQQGMLGAADCLSGALTTF